MRALLLPLAVLAVACDPYYVPQQIDGPLLLDDAQGRAGHVFMLAPESNALIDIDAAGRSFAALPVGRNPRVLSRAPGGESLYVLELASGSLSRLTGSGDLRSFDLGVPFNALDWAPDGARAVAWIDPTSPDQPEVDGSLNPNAIALITDLAGELTVDHFTLSFPPLSVQFVPASQKLLIGSTDRLHVIDLETLDERAVPFSGDQTAPRRPNLIVPSPDGSRALVTVMGSSDLFVVSLDPVLIENVIGLGATAVGAAFSADGSRAVLTHGTLQTSFLDLDTFESASLTLPHTARRILVSRGATPFALLYDERVGRRGLTRVDLDLARGEALPDDPDSWTLADDTRAVLLSPDETAAVVLHDVEGGATDFVETRALSLFSFDERAPSRILLDSAASDLVFLEAGVIGSAPEDPHVIVSLQGTGRLVRYNLRTYAQVVLDTYDAPIRLGVLGGEGPPQLFVVHDDPLGLVSFVPAAAERTPPGGFPAVAGMAANGLLDRR